MVNLCICNKAGTRREEVGTLSLGSNIGRNSIDAVTRHEVMHVQITYLDISIIAHSGSMERTLSLYHSLALVGSDVGKILLTIGLHTSLCRQRRYAIVALHITWQHSHHKAQILGVGLELHVSTQLIGSIEIGSKTCRCGVECGRQRHLHIVEVHMLHITLQQTTDSKRIFWPTLTHSGRHIAEERHDILFAQRCVHLQPHLPWVNRFHQ